MVLLGGLTAGCAGGALDAAGDEARVVRDLWWVMFVLGTVVFAAVLVLLAAALRARGERRDGPEAADDGPEVMGEQTEDDVGAEADGAGEEGDAGRAPGARTHRFVGEPMVVLGGIALPAVVLALLLGLTVWASADLRTPAEDPVRIEVTGHQFWWDVRYPDLGVRTANQLRMPVDQEVELIVRSEDVIHSIWVPELAGKIDLIPGRTNHMTFTPEREGTFRGRCAEFCGIQHTRMDLLAVVQDEAGFEAWAQSAAGPRPTPDADDELFAGWQTFFSSACSYCHAIEGTPATSEVGPDLTDLATRDEIGSGTLANDRGNLAGWILDPQHSKPGNLMPGTQIEAGQMDALLDYLESLR